MKPQVLVLSAIFVQEIIAWDYNWIQKRNWKNWEKHENHHQQRVDRHEHHRHHRHHRHRHQMCEATTTSSAPSKPSYLPPDPYTLELYFPGNLAGNLTSSGIICGISRTKQAYDRFNGIFFGDFITSQSQDILGPLAIKGAFSGHGYTINGNHDSNCSDVDNSMDGYGLVLGSSNAEDNYDDIHVHGAVYLPENANVGNVTEQGSGCSTSNTKGTGVFNFDKIQTNAIAASEQFSLVPPTLHLSSEGVLTRIADTILDYDVITFGTCNECTYDSGFSSPDAIYFGIGNWNGPQGMSWPSRLIINIPVIVGTELTIQGNQPSQGMTVCTTVLNFYPADNTGSYSSGSFQLNRNTGGQLGGFTLMPEGNIVESDTGNFAGQIIANDYRWGGNGVELHDYNAIGGNCIVTDVCIPIFSGDEEIVEPIEPAHSLIPIPVTSASTENSSSSSSNESSSDSSTGSSRTESNSSSSEISSTSSSITSSSSNGIDNSSTESSSSNAASSSSSDSLNQASASSSTESSQATETECHTHNHHEIFTTYGCDQGYEHEEEILVCADDSHHHHRKDYYYGNDDDNFGNDIEFGLYENDKFDEECDIDHDIENNAYYEKNYHDYEYHKYEENEEDEDEKDEDEKDEDEKDEDEEDEEDEDEEDEEDDDCEEDED